jgi:hypothetical protein
MSDNAVQCDKCKTQKGLVFFYRQEFINKEGKASLSNRHICRNCASQLDKSIKETLEEIQPEALKMSMRAMLKA